jgi:hypothetical protein
MSDIHPWTLMPTARPQDFPQFFTNRPDNNVDIPTYSIPGVYTMTAAQAYGVVGLLTQIGVQCTLPYWFPSGDSLQVQVAVLGDTARREYFTRPLTPASVEIPASQSFSLMQIAIRLGGMNESPTQGLADILDDMRVKHSAVRAQVTDQNIVDALKRIFE